MVSRIFGLRGIVLGLACVLASPGLAQTAATLPGGASSLNEVHGDWTVQCGPATRDASAGITCVVSQQQQDPKSQQRVLAIAVTPSGQAAKGTLVMPFGLSLAKGVALQVDDSKDQTQLAFRTCLPAGCLVSLDWTADMVKALRGATKLNLSVVADSGQKVAFPISMNGFGSALDRVQALTGPAQSAQ